MHLPLILAAIVALSSIYLLLQYATRALDASTTDDEASIDQLPDRDIARAA
jgi:hypothetical protein